MSTKLSKRNALLTKRYPELQHVPEELRQKMLRKAVLHPVILGTLFILGGFVLPVVLDYLVILLGIHTESSDPVTLLKLFALIAIPFSIIMIILKKALLPWSLRRVLAKNGFGGNK